MVEHLVRQILSYIHLPADDAHFVGLFSLQLKLFDCYLNPYYWVLQITQMQHIFY